MIKAIVLSLTLILQLFQTLEATCFKESFVVAIDIGHTRKHTGSTSARGVGEYYFNRDLAQQLLAELVQRGYKKIFLINEQEKDITLLERARVANRRQAQLLISIHHDSVQPHYLSTWDYQGKQRAYSDVFKGYSIFYSEKNRFPEKSLDLAHLLGTALLANGFKPSLHHAEKVAGENRDLVDEVKGIYRFDDLVILKKTRLPALLFECGIIVNREEEVFLTHPLNQEKMLMAITTAIENACQQKTFWQQPLRGSP